jgi:hypothetical protein
MGVRPAGVLRLGRRRFEPWQLLVMAVAPGVGSGVGSGPAAEGGQTGIGSDPAVAMEWVHSAVAEGADIVEVPGVPSVAPFVGTVRDAYPELVIGVRTGRGEVAREACAAVEAGVRPERVMVEGSRQVADLVASGWPVLVSLSDSDLAGDLARAAVFGWLGARVFRVQRVRETRRALRMVSAIRGDIPPAYAVRGLA